MVDHNVDLLNSNCLSDSFFHLSRTDPTAGFAFDATKFAGHTYPPEPLHLSSVERGNDYTDLGLRLRLGSHLAQHLRVRLEETKTYTSTVGISTSKLLSKLVGNMNKPRGQTTLLPPYLSTDERESNVISFVDEHEVGKIPRIGCKIAHKIREYVLQRSIEFSYDGIPLSAVDKVTVKDVRSLPGIGPEKLDVLLSGPGTHRGIGYTVWCLLHGVDDTEVSQARQVPRQISIEDSYGRLDSFDRVVVELEMLSQSLVKRMYADLTDDDHHAESNAAERDASNDDELVMTDSRRWLAYPKTLRLSTLPRPPPNTDGTRNRGVGRISRSTAVPNFMFTWQEPVDMLAQKLTTEVLVPLFRKLHPERSGWDLGLLNVAVTNMAETASESKGAVGRDIGDMFKRQDTVLKQWRVEDRDIAPDVPSPEADAASVAILSRNASSASGEDSSIRSSAHDAFAQRTPTTGDYDEWELEDDPNDEATLIFCSECGAGMPEFAMSAHLRYHRLGE